MTEIILNSQLSAKSEYSFLLKNEKAHDPFDQAYHSSERINDTGLSAPASVKGPSINCSVC